MIDRGAILCQCGHPDGEHAVTGECAVERAGLGLEECGCSNFLPPGGEIRPDEQVTAHAYFTSDALKTISGEWYTTDNEILVSYNVMHGIADDPTAYPYVHVWMPRDQLARILFPEAP